MTVVVDTSAMLAFMDPADDFARPASRFFEALDDDLVTSPLAVAEMDHMIRRRMGRVGEALLRENLQTEALAVRWWADAMAETLAIATQNQRLSLADASLIALCDRMRTDRIAAFDTDFDTTTPGGRVLVRLPERKD